MKDTGFPYAPATLPASSGSLDATYRRTAWRIMPLLFLGFVVSYLDLSNIGFAKLRMQDQLALSESVYGLGPGTFFIGYFLFEVPSNLLLHRFGARRWIARIMISWGVLSALMFVVRGPASFYALRFLLGVAEAGLVPGVILYRPTGFGRRAARAWWRSSMPRSPRPASSAARYRAADDANPHGTRGLSGWQWPFLLEGVPSVLMGLVIWRFLDESLAHAAWLSAAEKASVIGELDAPPPGSDKPAFRVFVGPYMWLLTTVFFMMCAGIVGVGLCRPSLVQATGVRNLIHIGVLTAIPYVAASIAMIVHGRHSDRSGERRWHVALPMLIGALGLARAVRVRTQHGDFNDRPHTRRLGHSVRDAVILESARGAAARPVGRGRRGEGQRDRQPRQLRQPVFYRLYTRSEAQHVDRLLFDRGGPAARRDADARGRSATLFVGAR
ncbi:UNVERIFIED_ORG: MFS family permease [Paraburkholderia sediminicola]|nr:MFS family permease [Paraburkholderia sediminicola]